MRWPFGASPSQPNSAGNFRVLGGLGLALAVGSVYLVTACTAQGRYRTLSFLFDGVPDPSKPAEADLPRPERVDFTKLSAGERAEFLANRIEAPTVYFHQPVQERLCDSCHVAEKRQGQTSGWMAGLPQLVAPIEELCGRCHQAPEAEYVHGPVSIARCDLCHVAHQSPFPHLLRYEQVDEICVSCHQGETFVSQEKHAEYEETTCTACHDPHQSDRRHLLRDLDGPADPEDEGFDSDSSSE